MIGDPLMHCLNGFYIFQVCYLCTLIGPDKYYQQIGTNYKKATSYSECGLTCGNGRITSMQLSIFISMIWKCTEVFFEIQQCSQIVIVPILIGSFTGQCMYSKLKVFQKKAPSFTKDEKDKKIDLMVHFYLFYIFTVIYLLHKIHAISHF